jgi:hypothetical protein
MGIFDRAKDAGHHRPEQVDQEPGPAPAAVQEGPADSRPVLQDVEVNDSDASTLDSLAADQPAADSPEAGHPS